MSTPSSEGFVTPRPSTSDPPTQSGPMPLFEHHLRVLTDSYLSFFQERKRIEEVYVESLLKLHRKVKSLDTYLDDRADLSTARKAWNEVRDNVEREAQTRQAFLTTLTVDVVNSLTALKETQDRTRKRIKEDLKESGNAYNEYAENMLPKLKRGYLKKCQEVEDHKAAAAAAPPHTPYAEQGGTALSNSRSNPSLPSKPVVTSPHPLRPLDRRPSGSGPTTRNRSPSTSTAFSDFAQHGKKQLNQLITFLDKTGTVKESLGVRSDSSALRAVRAKREADEADKEYRKGVHWLETLRLRRTKILESAYKSLEMFVHEYSSTVKDVLEKYIDNMTATSMTQTQLSSHARSMVDKISPEKDVAIVSTHIPRSLASATPKPILYYNYNVGECNDLIFGVSLVDYATARGLAEGDVPKIVRICIQEVDQRGLESEGVYRVSGRHAIVQDLQHKIERNEAAFKFNPLTDDVYAVSSLLKLYLRELPEPIFRYPLQDRIDHTEDRAEHQSNNFALLRSKIRRLPLIHRATLRALLEHLARVAALSDKNKMDSKNLAIVFGGVIFGEDEIPKVGDLLSVQSWKDTLMEDLIKNASVLFDEPSASNSPPLPAAPIGEPTPTYTYGSSHTRIGSVPPRSQSPRTQEDFTPRLPLRPTGSIHPSLRANPVSPMRATMDIPPLPPRPATSDEEGPPSPTTEEEESGTSPPPSSSMKSPRTRKSDLSTSESSPQ
ncbi:RhoGAP-domain-containing protein [Leucogyrophana mollusca]|uniref:RhoGAP-domain-containing protein n=1 Tax=Leucogyrophana mollusca TaxID=85980 RepID=A0ACB8BV74_9AGAM|nr:RhoGAP-domain-containing protein [Leucogyrophana mollusca]